ncbi:MAG: hypothetical protein K6A28_04685, partial [Bacteroidales bacterium]|nr:hypothetical protein [Bacteroidales bacterium]
MKKLLLTLFICLSSLLSFADSVLIEGFEYANQDMAVPIGWISDDQSWLCGKFDKDHNRTAHSGNWYAFTNADDSWMYMDMFMTNQLRYRYSCWAISDGSYRLEIWGGNEPTAEGMTQLFLCDTVDSGEYEYFSSSMQHLAPSCQYLGIHAVALGDAYHLTIDDVIVDLVNKYDLIVNPAELDTVMYPGTEVTFTYEVHNIGYLDLVVFANAYGDEFSNVQFTADGATGALGSTFNTDPDQTVLCTCTATLSPGIPAGTRCWLDIMFTVSCDCLTRMATIFVDVLGETDEFPVEASFDAEAFYKDGWVLGDGMPKWEWTDEGEGFLPYDDSQGMLYFPASQTAASALLFSPKVVLDETDNHMRMMLYRDGEHANNEDRVNVYFNDILSIHGATPLGTVHR